MAISTPFCNLINLFSSIKYDQEYEMSFWNEIYGCVSNLGISYETIMSMPVHIRKFWIAKHNIEAEKMEAQLSGNAGGPKVEGEMLNDFAIMEQSKPNKNWGE